MKAAPDYREETDYLLSIAGFQMQMLAERLGVSLNTVNRARMDGVNSRTAPKGWERATGEIMLELAEQRKQEAASLFRRGRALSTGAGK
jgi:hypothetical protein